MMVEVDADELETMRSELKRLRAREDELLGRNTELVDSARMLHEQGWLGS